MSKNTPCTIGDAALCAHTPCDHTAIFSVTIVTDIVSHSRTATATPTQNARTVVLVVASERMNADH